MWFSAFSCVLAVPNVCSILMGNDVSSNVGSIYLLYQRALCIPVNNDTGCIRYWQQLQLHMVRQNVSILLVCEDVKSNFLPFQGLIYGWRLFRRSSKRMVCRYLSAALGKIVTITLPRFSSLLASCKAAQATAPLLIPTERPSCSMRCIAVVMASWSVTGTTVSMRSILSVSG